MGSNGMDLHFFMQTAWTSIFVKKRRRPPFLHINGMDLHICRQTAWTSIFADKRHGPPFLQTNGMDLHFCRQAAGYIWHTEIKNEETFFCTFIKSESLSFLLQNP